MPILRHTLISASAGSGKTYQLVQRYLHLLACGEQPSRIAAMTFTRKAAGEFVSRILRALSELAEDQNLADKFVAQLKPQPEQPVDFARILREVLRGLPRLRLGTIDSFFATVAACFPIELGLPVGASIMSEEESRQAASEVMEHLMGRLYRDDDRAAARTLLEAFKQATFGNEEKKVMATLTDWLRQGHDLWHECEDGLRWGRPAAIWPRDQHPHAAVWNAGKPLAEALDQLVETFSSAGFNDKALAAWSKIQEQAAAHRPGSKPAEALVTFITRLAPLMEQLRQGDATFEYHRVKWNFSGPCAQAALVFMASLVGQDLLVRCLRTQGIRQVIDAYAAVYDATVRGRGRLSFADLARLLAKAQGDGSWADEDSAADLWYRLDGRVDHWLFDEFQDTSAQQWSIMRGLVGEVLQDAEQRRSFFAVGDVKQSIYLWRKAEPQLFGQVLTDNPDKDGRGIEKTSLAKSYRSCQEVLDLVNGVYGSTARLSELLGDGSLKYWEFEPHTSACKEPHGVGAFIQPAETGKDEEQPDAWDVTAALLRQIQPARRGLSCAVLVRSNGHAREMTEYLREHTGQDILSQSEEHPAADNPACAALLAVLQLAAHPGDTLALEHLRMTPLAAFFEGDDNGRTRMNGTLRDLHDEGFASVIEAWVKLLTLPLDEFSQRRLGRLVDIASEFDEKGSRDVDEFLEFARGYGVRTGGAHLAVQVMTVHKSKGLEFDVVIVPLLDNSGLKNVEPGLVLKREGLDEAHWVLQFPPQPFDQLDEVLAARRQRMEEDEGFEALCRYYVAMTRAKRGLYVVASRPPKKAATVNAARLMRETLQQGEPCPGDVDGLAVEWLRVFGQADWFAGIAEVAPPAAVPSISAPPPLGPLLRELQPMPKRRTPSGEESFAVKGSVLFSPGREIGRNLGTLVHALMEQVAWIDGSFDEAALMAAWQARGLASPPAFERAREQALNVIRSQACRAAFTPPGEHFKLWRERPFDLVLEDDEWISGTVDRVNVACDAAGRPVSATIIDFKTDDVPDEEKLKEKIDGYRPQIALYRQAVAKLTGLHAEKIAAMLLFTRVGRLAPV